MSDDAVADLEQAFEALFYRKPNREIPLYDDLDSLEMIQLLDVVESDFGWHAPTDMEIAVLTSLETLAARLEPACTETS